LRGKGRLLIAVAALAALLFAGAAGLGRFSGSSGPAATATEGGAGIGGK
jgi:hypothetical protein